MITVKGIIADFLRVNIKRDAQGNIDLIPPQLTDSILSELNLNGTNIKGKLTQQWPASSSINMQMPHHMTVISTIDV